MDNHMRENMRRSGRGSYDSGCSGYYEGTFRGGTGCGRYSRTNDDYGRSYDERRERSEEEPVKNDMTARRVLSKEEIMEWKEALMININDSSKNMFSDEIILKRAADYHIVCDMFTEDELIVATMMMYTDYWKVCGRNTDKYVQLADSFLRDEDAALKYGEKLAMYHDVIVLGE